MTLRLEDVVSVGRPRILPDFRKEARAPYAPTRRHLMKSISAFGMGLGLSTIGALPTAKAASAAPPGGWKIWASGPTRCSGLGSWVINDNCNGCNQKKLCCCTGGGYHRADGCHYAYRPDKCHSGGYDGWRWKPKDCCGISGHECSRYQEWRCSDGYYRSNCRSGWTASICRYRTYLGSQPCRC